MRKTYADECLEIADKATPGPWKNDCGNGQVETEDWRIAVCDRVGNSNRKDDAYYMYDQAKDQGLPEEIENLLKYDNENDMDFIAHARTAVPELARRLKISIEKIRYTNEWLADHDIKEQYDTLNTLCDELESPLGKK